MVVVPRAEEVRFQDMCQARHVPAERIGVVDAQQVEAALEFQGLFTISLSELGTASEATFPSLFD